MWSPRRVGVAGVVVGVGEQREVGADVGSAATGGMVGGVPFDGVEVVVRRGAEAGGDAGERWWVR